MRWYPTFLLALLVGLGFNGISSGQSSSDDEKCKELLRRLDNLSSSSVPLDIRASRNAFDLSTATTVDNRVIQTIRSAKPKDLLVLNSRLVADERVKRTLEDSKARVVLQTTSPSVPEFEVTKLLQAKARTLKLIPVLPTNEIGAKAVFGSEADSAAVVKYMSKVRSKLTAFDAVSYPEDRPAEGSTRDRILKAISAPTGEDMVVVLCHNKDGIVPLPDGSPLTLQELSAALRGRRGIVLTCASADVSEVQGQAVLTTRRLEFDEMAASLVYMKRHGFFDSDRTFGEFLSQLNVRLNANRGPADGVVKVVLAVIGAGTMSLVAVNLSKRECNCAPGCDCCNDPTVGTRTRNCCQKPCCKSRAAVTHDGP